MQLNKPLLHFIKTNPRAFSLGMLFLIITNSLDGIYPLIMKRAIDEIEAQASLAQIGRTSLLFFILMASLAFTRYGWRVHFGRFHTFAAEQVRQNIFSHMTKLGPNFFHKNQVGELMSLVTNDVQSFRQAIGPGLWAKDNAGRNALHWAAANTPQVVQRLLEKGFDPSERDNLARTALDYARNDSVVRLLVALNANANAPDTNGATPLHTTASAGLTSAVTGLANAGANLNAPDKAGRTPLHYAITAGFEATCRELLRLKADPLIKANDGVSAAELGRASKNSAIKKLFPAAAQPKGGAKKGKKK